MVVNKKKDDLASERIQKDKTEKNKKNLFHKNIFLTEKYKNKNTEKIFIAST